MTTQAAAPQLTTKHIAGREVHFYAYSDLNRVPGDLRSLGIYLIEVEDLARALGYNGRHRPLRRLKIARRYYARAHRYIGEPHNVLRPADRDRTNRLHFALLLMNEAAAHVALSLQFMDH